MLFITGQLDQRDFSSEASHIHNAEVHTKVSFAVLTGLLLVGLITGSSCYKLPLKITEKEIQEATALAGAKETSASAAVEAGL